MEEVITLRALWLDSVASRGEIQITEDSLRFSILNVV